jgi:ATP-dependent Clp protease protease subunit
MGYYKPDILQETAQGMAVYGMEDEMFKNRTVLCIGDLGERETYSLILQLLYLEKEDPDKEIKMIINSTFGSLATGMALLQVMQKLRCPVHTICMGCAGNLSAVLFIAGNTRDMLPHSRIMIRDPRAYSIGGTPKEIQQASADIQETRKMIASIIAERTGKSLKSVLRITAKDSYFFAKDAIKAGFADHMITTIEGEE